MAVASPQSLAPETPDPVALINAWLAVEALQPQTFATQEDLLGREPPPAKRKTKGKHDAPLPRALFPFDLAGGQMPGRARRAIASSWRCPRTIAWSGTCPWGS